VAVVAAHETLQVELAAQEVVVLVVYTTLQLRLQALRILVVVAAVGLLVSQTRIKTAQQVVQV
jgi:xanthosine utilization system XapX-like protein